LGTPESPRYDVNQQSSYSPPAPESGMQRLTIVIDDDLVAEIDTF
jgi:hypothetical protein